MKKILLTLGFICFAGFSFAQSVNFGLKAGVNFSSLAVSGEGISANSSSTTGFHAGLIADFGLGNISLQPAVLFSTKGASSSGSTDGSSDLKLNYIEVPVNLLYNVKIPAVGKIFVGGGPYIAYGVSGNNGVTFGSSSEDLNNPDIGLNVLGGFKFNTGLFLSAGYGFGLTNLSNVSEVTVKNRVASISIGYFFL